MNRRLLGSIFFSLLTLSATGCSPSWIGRWETVHHWPEGATVEIPYVEGDAEGLLTAEIIAAFARRVPMRYVNSCGRFILRVKILGEESEDVGFRYHLRSNHKRGRDLVASEARLFLLVEASLVDASSGTVVVGPSAIGASVDFDHDEIGGSSDANVFSMGQLADVDTAYEMAARPLYRRIAEKVIVDVFFIATPRCATEELPC